MEPGHHFAHAMQLRDLVEHVRSVLMPLVAAYVCEQIWLRGPISSTRKKCGGLFHVSEVRVQSSDILVAELSRRGIRVPCPDRKTVEHALLRSMQELDIFDNCSSAWGEIRGLRNKIISSESRHSSFEHLIAPFLCLHRKNKNIPKGLAELQSCMETLGVLSALEVLAK